MTKQLFLPLVVALGLSGGCSLAPDYERPTTAVATQYPAADASATAPTESPVAVLPWTDFFRDDRVNALIALALDHNQDLQIAALNIERVRAVYNIQRTALIPTLEATGSDTRQRVTGDFTSSGSGATYSTYAVAANIPAYEVDLFGRIASLRDQARAEYFASEEVARSVRISLISAVTRQAFATLALQEQYDLAVRNFEAAEKLFDLNQQSFDAGITSELALRTAQTQREAVRATLAALQQQLEQAQNALVLLIGAPLPDDLPAGAPLHEATPIAALPVGLPSDLLIHRPDIRATEQSLLAANANIGAARAAFFPSIQLTASAGTSSPDLDNLFTAGARTWSFSPSVTVPIFTAGANRARLNIAEVEKRIEIANYRQAIQTAFREVADALAVGRSIDVEIDAQNARATAAARRFELSQQRFEAGIDPYLSVLLAQQELFGAQSDLIQARLAKASNLASLYAALGGGGDVLPVARED